jgi:hypothetical protein
MMRWTLSHRFDARALPLADAHYNRQKIGSPQFVPPGRCLVLLTPAADALWVTSWPFWQYVRHRWPGAWVCSLFRREPSSPELASDLITDAVGATRWKYGEPPALGIVTFVNRDKTKPKRDPGYCFLMAGWEYDGETKGGLIALRQRTEAMPAPMQPLGITLPLFAGSAA